MSDHVDATVYLQVAPEVNRYASTESPHYIHGAKVVGSTQKKSQSPKAGTVEVKLTIRIPKSAFLPLRPQAVVVVPESMTEAHPVEVIAEDVHDE